MKRLVDWSIIKKGITGTSDSSEQQQYEQWLAQNQTHGDFAHKIDEYYKGGEDCFEPLSDVALKGKFFQFAEQIRRQKRRRLLVRVSSVAATVVILSISALTYLYDDNTDGVFVAEVAPEIKSEIVVQPSGVILSIGQNAYTIDKDKNVKGSQVEVSGNRIDYMVMKKVDQPIEYHELSVPKGKDWRVRLSDGTEIILNANSQLRYPNRFTDGDERIVYLKGEGYFDVKHNTESRFIVKTDGVDVRVYGTKFNINSYDKFNIETVLVNGSVSLKGVQDEKELFMKPNQKVICSMGKNKAAENVDAQASILWTKGLLLFNEERMEEILQKLSYLYDFQFDFERDELKDVRVYCYMPRPDSVSDVLKVLSANGEIRYKLKDNKVTIW